MQVHFRLTFFGSGSFLAASFLHTRDIFSEFTVLFIQFILYYVLNKLENTVQIFPDLEDGAKILGP